VPQAVDRAAVRRVADRTRHGAKKLDYTPCARVTLDTFAEERKTYVTSQYLAFRRRFQRAECPATDEATANEATLDEFESRWNSTDMKLSMVPGKDALSRFNEQVQQKYGITVTSTGIIDSMKKDEFPTEMKSLIESLDEFAAKRPGSMKGIYGTSIKK
jgi:hypothetical protein